MPVIVLGIVVKPSAPPSVGCVVLSGTVDDPHLVESFYLKSSEDTLVNQIDLLAKALNSKLSGMSADVVVIRVADFARVAARLAATSNRLLIEGALAFVARGRVASVHIWDGKRIGDRLGMPKDQADARGRKIDSARSGAAAAALSALVTDQ